MTEHFKAPEIIQLSSKKIANLSDAQFKTLVIFFFFIVMQLQLYAFSPHPSTPPRGTPKAPPL